MRRIAAILSALALATSLAACNTVEGLGEDLDAAGEELDEDLS